MLADGSYQVAKAVLVNADPFRLRDMTGKWRPQQQGQGPHSRMYCPPSHPKGASACTAPPETPHLLFLHLPGSEPTPGRPCMRWRGCCSAGASNFTPKFNAWLDSLKRDGTTMKVGGSCRQTAAAGGGLAGMGGGAAPSEPLESPHAPWSRGDHPC